MLAGKLTGWFCSTGYKLKVEQPTCPICGQPASKGEISTIPRREYPQENEMMVIFDSGKKVPYKLTHR